MRAPLWQQRKRAADLLAVASRYSSFPILLETYRECMRDVFDLPAAADILQQDPARRNSRHRASNPTSLRRSPPRCCSPTSPTTSTKATLRWPNAAPRRCPSINRNWKRFSATPICANCSTTLRWTKWKRSCKSLEPDYQARHADGVHDLLLKLGDLDRSRNRRALRQPGVAATIDGTRPTRAAPCACASPANRASFPSNTPAAIATPWHAAAARPRRSVS